MKTVITILVFLTMSLTAFAQQDVVTNNETELVESTKEVKAETTEASNAAISAEVKAKVLKMNRKKSNEIISIKSFRRSLQIRVKTVKLC